MISHRLAKADPRLLDQFPEVKPGTGYVGAAFEGGGKSAEEVSVIVLLNRDKWPQRFGKAKPWRIARGMFTVTIGRGELDDLLACPDVEWVYSSQPMRLALEERRDPMNYHVLRSGEGLRRTGRNAIVGIIDYGFDLTHPDFRKEDGKTRVAWYWDQSQTGTAKTVGYGVEFDRERIDQALQTNAEASKILGAPDSSHGTNVALIAAGNSGVAPGAILILVNLKRDPVSNMPSNDFVVQALGYIFSKAANYEEEQPNLVKRVKSAIKAEKRGKPCVINLSVSRNEYGHDGQSAVEQAIDRLVSESSGRAVVVAAGNRANDALHAMWDYDVNQSRELKWVIPRVPSDEKRLSSYDLELWYSSRDEISVQVISPDGKESADIRVNMDDQRLVGTTSVHIISTRFFKLGGDSQILIRLFQPVMPGTWTVRLKVLPDSHPGRLHAWIDDTPSETQRPHFQDADPQCTVGSPGTSFLGIAVGNLDDHSMKVTDESGRGKTRDLREKPEVVAPGVAIGGQDSGEPESGTSMSAPHITGLVACLFEENGSLNAQQIQKILTAAANGSKYDEAAGYGMVDAPKALRLVQYFVRS